MGQETWTALESYAVRLSDRFGVTASVLIAVVTLVAGLLLAMLGRRLTRALVRRGGRLVAGLGRSGEAPDTSRVEGVVGTTVYFGILLFAIMAATEMLGLPVVTSWLTEVVSYLPRVVVAMLILALGTVLARVAREVVARAALSARAPGGERIGRIAEVALLVASGLVAIEQLGIEVSFLKTSILILLAAVLGGAALSFGLGSRDLVANVLSAHYLQRTFQVGQTIRVGDVEGRIVRITEIAVVVQSGDGEIVVPAQELTQTRSTLVLKASAR
jgi:small-conductance mechanosensitive channel